MPSAADMAHALIHLECAEDSARYNSCGGARTAPHLKAELRIVTGLWLAR